MLEFLKNTHVTGSHNYFVIDQNERKKEEGTNKANGK